MRRRVLEAEMMDKGSQPSELKSTFPYVAALAAIQLAAYVVVLAVYQYGEGHHVVWALATACVLSITAAGVAMRLLRRRSLHPIEEVRGQVEEIEPAHLSQRIELSSGPKDVHEAVDALNAMLDRLEAALIEQTKFIANVSHELKTPLTYLLGQTQLIRRQARTPEEHDRFVDNIEAELRRMADTINSFLTLARARGGLADLSVTPVTANDLVLGAVEHCQPLARHREVQVIPTLAPAAEDGQVPQIRGDADLLSAMIENLIRNAIQHSPVEGKVDVTLRCQDGGAHIFVRDRGKGIPPEELETIFERYRRSNSDDSELESAGLGLAIAKAVARMHGGSISADNHPDGGAEFEVKLPLADTA
jgi:signal transduction histidine kinase